MAEAPLFYSWAPIFIYPQRWIRKLAGRIAHFRGPNLRGIIVRHLRGEEIRSLSCEMEVANLIKSERLGTIQALSSGSSQGLRMREWDREPIESRKQFPSAARVAFV